MSWMRLVQGLSSASNVGLGNGGRMVFRTASAIATLLIGLGGGARALAQYSPSAQAYPPQAYPPPQAPVADADEAAPPLNAPVFQGPALPPIGVGGGQGYQSVQPPSYYGGPPPVPPRSPESASHAALS